MQLIRAKLSHKNVWYLVTSQCWEQPLDVIKVLSADIRLMICQDRESRRLETPHTTHLSSDWTLQSTDIKLELTATFPCCEVPALRSGYLKLFNNIFRTNLRLTFLFRGVWKLTIIFSEQILTRSLFSPLSASLLHWPSDCRQQKKNPNPNAGFESFWTLLDKVSSDLPADGVVRIFSWVKARPINLELASSCVCA